MLKTAFRVDENGFINESFVVSVGENGTLEYYLDELGNKSTVGLEQIIKTDLPQPCFMIKPMWNGNEWVEGESEEERTLREEEMRLVSLTPSQAEIEDSELEIKVITILMEMEVI